MSRRPTAGGKAHQKRRRKTIMPKGARRRASHAVGQETEVARLAREGPPDEAVGLEPYGPPEAMPAGARP